MGWVLAIDVGTTSTAAARRVDNRTEVIQLKGAPQMPSMAFWKEGTGDDSSGRLVLGAEADNLSARAPWCLERSPKSRLGEDLIYLGDQQFRPVEIIGEILREVLVEAMTLSGGEQPSEVRLTHPARWRQTRLDRLAAAAKLAGLPDPVFVPEPVAAAVHFASARLADGEHVAVYDLGGGTLDTAVLRRDGDSFELVGRTGGDEELGGEDFDDLLYRRLGERLSGESWELMRTADERRDRSWGQANREFLRQARLAKEGLSTKPEYGFYLPSPIDQELDVSIDEFERLITPTLRLTVAELERTILAAGLQPSQVTAIYLAGGSSRIPQVGLLIEERIGIPPEHLDDPKSVIALGAARLEDDAARHSEIVTPSPAVRAFRASPPPPPPPPPPGARGEGPESVPDPPLSAGDRGGEVPASPPPPPPGGRLKERGGAPPPLSQGVGAEAIEPTMADSSRWGSSNTELVAELLQPIDDEQRDTIRPDAGKGADDEGDDVECTNCGTALPGGSAICINCGRLNRRRGRRGARAPIRRHHREKSDLVCTSCGEHLELGHAVCPSCGFLNLRPRRRK